jgi:glycosyltransferase involved in cell wall biosynthesis
MARPIVCFGEDWGRHPGAAQDIMERLAATRTVLWIDSLGLRRPHLTLDDARRVIVKLKNWSKGARSALPMVLVYTPLVLPFYGSKVARAINALILRIGIRRLLKRNGMVDPVLWVSCPAGAGVVGELGEAKSIYYCADEYSVFPGMSREVVTELEQELFKKVDLVIVTSKNLYDKKKPFHDNITLIPHGVDFAHFSKAARPETVVPDGLQRIKKPIIGFYGLIQDLIDFDLVCHVVKARPDWSVVMIGPVIFDAGPLPALPNLHFLGGRDLQDLPSYVKGFDVCMIPYKLVDRTIYANPLKLRQYLASGKPVVSTPLPEVMKYGGLVKIGKDRDEYVRHIEFLLEHDTPECSRTRMDAVRGESWECIIQQIDPLV